MQFGGKQYNKERLFDIASRCIVKLVAREISEDEAKLWCQNQLQQ